jgi:hypothetical protein
MGYVEAMSHRAVLVSLVAASLVFPSACVDDSLFSSPSSGAGVGGGGGVGATGLIGGIQKGPFVLGSTVQVSTLAADGSPTGDVFSTQTSSDAGEFNLDIGYQGLISIEASGFYFDEVSGALSGAPLTLRARAELGAVVVPTFVNLITHLSYNRQQVLMDNSSSFSDARDQAEAELRATMMIGPIGFDPGAQGVALDLLGGDNDANAYLFAVSAVLMQVALTRAAVSGSVSAHIQEVVNVISSDLSDDGAISPSLVAEIQAAEATVDAAAVEANLEERLQSIGSSAVVPDLDRVLDSDNDGVANAHDNCPFIANPDQMPVAGLCRWEIQVFDTPALAGAANGAVGDFDNDGDADILLLPFNSFELVGPNQQLIMLENDGNEAFTIKQLAVTLPTDSGFQPAGGYRDAHAVDMTGDNALDVVFLTTGWRVLAGNGDGTFAPSFELLDPNDAFTFATQVVDLDGDMRPDVVGTLSQVEIGVAMGNVAGGRDAAVTAGFSALQQVTSLAVGDFFEDGQPDVVVAEARDNQLSTRINVLAGDGSGGLSVAGFVDSSLGYPADVEVADFDGDGHLDISAFLFNGTLVTFAMWFGDGQGGLGNIISEPVTPPPLEVVSQVALRGPAGEALVEVAVCNPPVGLERHTFRSLMGTGFEGPSFELFGCHPIRGDINGDGWDDLVLLPSVGNDFDESVLTLMLINP